MYKDMKPNNLQNENSLEISVTKEAIVKRISLVLTNLWTQLNINKEAPLLKIKSRSKSNLEYDIRGYYKLGASKYISKTLKTKGGAKELLKITKTLVYLLDQFYNKKSSTAREFYYCALNWISEAQFQTIEESNFLLENLEIVLDCLREDFGIVAEADGTLLGPITIKTKNRANKSIVTDCQKDVSDAGFLLPRRFEDMEVIKHNAKRIIVCETGGLHARLVQNEYDVKTDTILVHSKGHASRCLKKFLKYANEVLKIPVYIFNDCDIYGIQIANVMKRGAVKSSHISDKLCTPNAIHIGLLPSHIERFKLPTDTITKEEEKLIKIFLDDPKVQEYLKKELEIMYKTKKKAEQQSLSYWGLNFVTEVYLPEIIKELQHK